MQKTRTFQVFVAWDAESQVWMPQVLALHFFADFGAIRQAALNHTRDAIIGYLEAAKQEGIPVLSGEAGELVDIDVPIS
jgi:hypothetical protein